MGGLKELEPISMTDTYGYEEIPKAYTSAVGSIDQPTVTKQTASLGAIELGQAKLPQQQNVSLGATELGRKRLSVQLPPAPPAPESAVMQFIEKSQEQGITAKTANQDWLMDAVGHILNGKLTEDNKLATLQNLLEIADIVVMAPLRDDQTISDDEYATIASSLDRRIRNFMDKLYVGGIYRTK